MTTARAKGVSLDEVMASLSPARRAEVEAGAAELIAQEYALRAARKARTAPPKAARKAAAAPRR